MSSPSSCSRCSKPLVLAPESGLCPECASSADTANPTSPAFLPVEPDVSPVTASHNPAPLFADSTASANLDGNTATGGPTGSAQYPHAPAGYELLNRLGGGGMGDVYLARESASDRLVAMKFLRYPGSPDALERFVIELRALARIDHKNVVRVFASDFLRSDPYFTMEYMPNGSLARTGALPPDEAVTFIRAVAEALAAAHAEQIIHRDLKPSNILLAADGTPKLSDFGLAKRLDADLSLTPASGALGTVQYMPPEQVTSRNGEIGPWSDVFGLGATLYHLLSGSPPFTGDTSQDIILEVVGADPPRLRDIPARLEGIVLKCLEKETEDRYQSMAELIADLDAYTAGQRPKAKPLTRWRRAKRWARRNRRTVLAAGLVAGAFVLGGAFWPTSGPAGTPTARPPVDPLPIIEKELDAVGTVELIGPDGKPRWHRWAVGEGSLIPSETKDGTIALQSQGLTFLELIPDPRRDRYRVTAILRHLQANPENAGVGMYIGFDTVAAAGIAVHPALLADFNETFTQSELATKTTQQHGVDLVAVTAIARRDESPSFGRTSPNGHLRFVPHPDQPRPWRVIVFEVSPDGVELFWATEAPADSGKVAQIGKRASVGRMPANSLAGERKRVQGELGRIIGNPPPVVPVWHPRRPLGIWAGDSTVAIKSVTVEPLP